MTSVSGVGEHDLQPMKRTSQSHQRQTRSVVILPGTARYDDRQQEAQRIDHDRAFASHDLHARAITSLPAAFAHANRLAVQDGRGRRRVLPRQSTNLFQRRIVEGLTRSRPTPAPKDRIRRSPVGKVLQQLPPLTAHANHGPDRVDDQPPMKRRVPPATSRRQHPPHRLPLSSSNRWNSFRSSLRLSFP